MTTYKGDNTNRSIPGVSSTPQGATALLSTGTITAGTANTFNFIINPVSHLLTLWDFLFTVVVDNNTALDSSGQFVNIFPNGSGLTSAQRLANVTNWVDWAQSSDRTNTRWFKIHIENNDISAHTYYVYCKAYTYSSTS